MNAALRVAAAGPGVTLQDAGRRGLMRFGVTPAGPMDAAAFAAANLAAGAPPEACAIEVSLGGLELAAEGSPVGLAVAGGAFRVVLDGRDLPRACVFALAPGARLTIRAGAQGAFAYVGVAGRIDLPPVLGSLATHTRSGLGGLEGRGLRAGDLLPLAELRPAPAAPMRVEAPWLDRDAGPICVLLGPQDDCFSREAVELFLSAPWRVSARSDRMAYRLDGPRLEHARGHDIVSDGVAAGAIQVPGDGAPLVLMADRQPTGGYPKIAAVVSADLPRLAQLRPSETLSFVRVSFEGAVAARRVLADAIASGVRVAPLGQDTLADALLSENLIGGAVSARGDF